MAKDIYTDKQAIKNEPEILQIKSILKPGDVEIDVVANHGLYTYNLSNTVGDNGFVYVFEGDKNLNSRHLPSKGSTRSFYLSMLLHL